MALLSSAAIHIGPIEVDPASGEVRNGTRTIRLQPQVVAVLTILLEHPGQVVTREEFRRRLWPDTTVDFEDGLNHAIARLREALRDSAHDPRIIETIPRRGYRFVGKVESEEQLRGAAGSDAETSTGQAATGVPRPPSDPGGRPPRLWRVPALIGILAIGGLLMALVGGRFAPAARIESLAVLPLADLSAGSDQAYFADGVTEELITELTKAHSVRVVSRTSSEQYRNTKKPVPAIARELGVDAIVEGSVQRAGDRVRVAVQLVRGRTDEHLWAEAYDVQLGDILSLRTRLARDIVGQISGRVGEPGTTPRTIVPAVYEAYLMGRSFARGDTRDGYLKSIEYFERAIALDPTYALAYALLAESHAMLAAIEDSRAPHLAQARASADRAVELAPNLAEVRLRDADLRFYWDWEWDQCEAGFRAALDLNLGSADAHEHYALCLSQLGRREESLREFERTLELDPLSARSHRRRADLLVRAGRREEALEGLRKAADLRPSDAALRTRIGKLLLESSRYEEALEAFTAAGRLRHDPEANATALADALRRRGPAGFTAEVARQDRAFLERQLAALEDDARARRVPPLQFAAVYAALGDFDRAFERLHQAYDERSPRLADLKGSPQWDPLRADPRYAALLERMRLPRN